MMTLFTGMTHIYDEGLKIKPRDLRLKLVTFWNSLAIRSSL